jgi:hypothetical protein
VDLRSNAGVSKNFYQSDYVYNLDDFTFTGESAGGVSKSFGSNYWPLLIVHDADHPSVSTLPNHNVTGLVFSFPKTSASVLTVSIFLGTGFKWKSVENKLVKNPKNKARIITDPEILDVPGTTPSSTLISDNKLKIGLPYNGGLGAFYLRLQAFEETGTSSSVNFVPENHLDTLFIVPATEKTVSTNELYIEKTGHLQYVEHPENNFKAIYELGIAWEESRVIFFAMPIAIENPENGFNIPMSFDENLYLRGSFYRLGEQWINGIRIAKHELDLPSGNVPLLRYQEKLFTDYWKSSEKDMLSLAMSRTEYQGLMLRINNNNYDAAIHPIFLTFDKTQATDNNGVDYYDANLGFEGYVDDQISTIQVSAMTTGTDFYSLDEYLYSSPDAGNEEGAEITAFSTFYDGDYSVTFSSTLAQELTNSGKGGVFSNATKTHFYQKNMKSIQSSAKALKVNFDITDSWPEKGKSAKATTYHPGSMFGSTQLPGDTITIIFKKSFVQGSSTISFVKTLYHEILHAYVNKLLQNAEDLQRDLPGIYDFYCRFGVDDKAPERSYAHNYMAAIQFQELVNGIRAYDKITQVTRPNGTVSYNDIFNNNLPETKSYTASDFYRALAWNGLQLTRVWREFARKNRDKIQIYIAIGFNEATGSSYTTHFPIYAEYDLDDFDYPLVPTPNVCN